MKHILIFIFVFSIEIKVKAEAENTMHGVLLEPTNCIEESNYCVIKVYDSKKFIFENNSHEFSLRKNSNLVRHGQNEFTLIQGEVLVFSKKGLKLSTPYGKVEIQPESLALVLKKENSYQVTVLQGKVLLHALGEPQSVEVLAGYENSISGVKNLKAQVEIPKPALIDFTLQSWAFLTWKKKAEFLEDIQAFQAAHSLASKELSVLSREIAMREVELQQQNILEQERLRTLREKEKNTSRQKTLQRLLLFD